MVEIRGLCQGYTRQSGGAGAFQFNRILQLQGSWYQGGAISYTVSAGCVPERKVPDLFPYRPTSPPPLKRGHTSLRYQPTNKQNTEPYAYAYASCLPTGP
jgi:hypothetical protein